MTKLGLFIALICLTKVIIGKEKSSAKMYAQTKIAMWFMGLKVPFAHRVSAESEGYHTEKGRRLYLFLAG